MKKCLKKDNNKIKKVLTNRILIQTCQDLTIRKEGVYLYENTYRL